MAIFIILFLGGALGWSLFAFTIFRLVCHRRKELEILNDVKEELVNLKEEIKNL